MVHVKIFCYWMVPQCSAYTYFIFAVSIDLLGSKKRMETHTTCKNDTKQLLGVCCVINYIEAQATVNSGT